jgi:hypothetical protein
LSSDEPKKPSDFDLRPRPRRWTFLLVRLQFPVEYGLFLAVNVLDLVFTMLFIRHGAGEANPLAKWFVLHGGKTAFIVYKAALTLAVIGLCEGVAKKRRMTARILLWFGIVAVGIVAVSSMARYYQAMTGAGMF